MNRNKRLNDFANRSFRDVADQDYIAARLSYRAELREPFLWSSLQAFEKYLKAILLYNRVSSKGVGHNLVEALKRVESITKIKFAIPTEVRDFLLYLNDYGTNRYMEYSTHLCDHALMKLDGSIWYVRRYCFYMQDSYTTDTGELINNLPANILKAITKEHERVPHKYKIEGGLLEQILAKHSEAAQYLIYHNAYYWLTAKKKIKNYKSIILCTSATLSMYPEAFNELDSLVQLSKMVRDHYKKLNILP